MFQTIAQNSVFWPKGKIMRFGNRRFWWVALASLVLLIASGTMPVTAQQPPTGPRSVAELIRVADDVYAFRYGGYITMFIVTDEGVITADPLGMQNPEAPAVLKAFIRSVTNQPVRYVINTHWGNDHAMGGAIFADTARFISHPIAAQRIAAANDPTTPVPDVLVADRLTLTLGGKQIDIYYAGVSQADDYLLVHYPARNVIFTVDFVREKAVAFRDFPNGNIMEWIKALNWIDEDLQYDTVILGHTPAVSNREAVSGTRQYLQDLVAAIQSARAAGQADNSDGMIAAVKAELAPKYGTWGNFDSFLPLNIAGAIRTM
ncbi:MAG: MBL fold metallo-hydrolase [Chloroflexi bacterium]|nr:MBL fold metallo-hydrolase [Chloroflexota bacterium]